MSKMTHTEVETLLAETIDRLVVAGEPIERAAQRITAACEIAARKALADNAPNGEHAYAYLSTALNNL